MDSPDTLLEVLERLALAVGCGAVLGWERQAQHKPAGLRTHMMVALGAAAFTLITLRMASAAAGQAPGIDPARVVSGVIGGIGFLGAGTIIRAGGAVRGITTAATIWVVGALGVACGLGYYGIASLTVGFALAILLALGVVERWLVPMPAGPGKPPGASDAD